jgi:uncharacterized membrane protein
MAALTVWKFPTADGADGALVELGKLVKLQLIKVEDAATVTWAAGKKKPKTHQAVNLTGAGAMSGAFWGMLFGLIFLVPFFGLAIGAAMGALSGHFKDYGIDDTFIESVRSKVTEGTSALFVLSSDAVQDKVVAEFKGFDGELIQSNLSAEQEAKLREAFGEE